MPLPTLCNVYHRMIDQKANEVDHYAWLRQTQTPAKVWGLGDPLGVGVIGTWPSNHFSALSACIAQHC